jgi:hypothetical protein
MTPQCALDYVLNLLFRLLGHTLGFQDNALQFLENSEMLIGVINLGIALLLAQQEADFFQPLEFTLDIAGIFFDKLRQTADVGLEIGVFRIDDNDLTPDTGCDENV